ncbi:MAG: hypothetical protein U0R72_18555 [Nakamurella multipartita]
MRAGYQHIRDRLPAGLAIIEPLGDGADGEIRWWRVTIHAQRLDWLPPKLLALECPVVIDEPAGLRDVVRACRLEPRGHGRLRPGAAHPS